MSGRVNKRIPKILYLLIVVFHGGKILKLFTAGPVACRPEVLEAMKGLRLGNSVDRRRQMFSHRSEEYKELHKNTVEKLKDFLETEENLFLYPSTGTGIMEGSIRSCINDKLLITTNGAFGDRYAEVANSNGKEVVKLEKDKGNPILPSEIDDKLSKNPDVEAVTITYNETSTGLLNPLPELAKVVNEHDKLLFVDAVSAMGGAEIKTDEWGIDIVFGSTQKAFGVPPGMAIGAVSDRALEKSENVKNRGWYLDLLNYDSYYKRKSGTPSTSPIPIVLAMNKMLKIIEEEGGKEERLKIYENRRDKIKKGIEEMGLTMFPEEGYESPTINCINSPDHMSGNEVYEKMRDYDIEIAAGYGDISEKTFRIGNMGYITMGEIDEMLEALNEVTNH